MDTQSLQEKAMALQNYLDYPTWLNFIGLGKKDGAPCLFVYTNKSKLPQHLIPETWQGVPVEVQKIGTIRTM